MVAMIVIGVRRITTMNIFEEEMTVGLGRWESKSCEIRINVRELASYY